MTPLDEHEKHAIKQIYSCVNKLAGGGQGNRYAILHAPASHKDIPCLLVGHKPGPQPLPGLNEEAGWPDQNILTTNFNIYSLAATALFSRAGRYRALENSQSTDICFFRDPVDARIEDACKKLVIKLIQILKPRSLVAIGKPAARFLAHPCETPNIGEIYFHDCTPSTRIHHLSHLYRAPAEEIKTSVYAIGAIVPLT